MKAFPPALLVFPFLVTASQAGNVLLRSRQVEVDQSEVMVPDGYVDCPVADFCGDIWCLKANQFCCEEGCKFFRSLLFFDAPIGEKQSVDGVFTSRSLPRWLFLFRRRQRVLPERTHRPLALQFSSLRRLPIPLALLTLSLSPGRRSCHLCPPV